jgi:hypothetical protein
VDEDLGSPVSIVKLVIGPTKTALVISTISTEEHVCECPFVIYVGLINFPDLRVIGQTTRIERSTLEQVRARIAYLREKTKEASNAKSFDFDQRLAEVKAKEAALREEKKAQKRAVKEQARVELVRDVATNQEEDEMAKLMGFGGFGSSKK